jgi:hypothetical protein
MPSRFTVARILLGLGLLATAGLKLYGLSVSAVPRVGWFAHSWAQLASAEWEVVLGLWLLSGAYPRLSWLAALITFAAFAAVSCYLAWVGVASCGCFGAVQTNPWWAFSIDLAVLALLLMVRPPKERYSEGKYLLGSIPLIAAGLLALLTAIGVLVYDSPLVALARLRGDSLLASDLNIEGCRAGEKIETVVVVRNLTNRPIRLIGGTSDCTCAAAVDLPTSIDPEGTAAISVRVLVPESSTGRFTRTVILHTDCAVQPRLMFYVNCFVQ